MSGEREKEKGRGSLKEGEEKENIRVFTRVTETDTITSYTESHTRTLY